MLSGQQHLAATQGATAFDVCRVESKHGMLPSSTNKQYTAVQWHSTALLPLCRNLVGLY